MSLLNERFKEIRQELGYSQQKYAEVLGIKRSSVGAYEEERAIVPLILIPKVMEIGNLPMEDMYDFLFDAKYQLK